jgi:hypothetical protein
VLTYLQTVSEEGFYEIGLQQSASFLCSLAPQKRLFFAQMHRSQHYTLWC